MRHNISVPWGVNAVPANLAAACGDVLRFNATSGKASVVEVNAPRCNATVVKRLQNTAAAPFTLTVPLTKAGTRYFISDYVSKNAATNVTVNQCRDGKMLVAVRVAASAFCTSPPPPVRRPPPKRTPPRAAPPAAPGALYAAVAAHPALTTLAHVLNNTSNVSRALLDLISPAAGVTLFAPSDVAFAQALNGSSNVTIETLIAITTYHIVMVPLKIANLTNGEMLPTLATTLNETDSEIMVHKSANGTMLMMGDSMAHVIQGDIPAGRSFIHVIDSVLLPRDNETETETAPPAPLPKPPTLIDVITKHSNLTMLAAALAKAMNESDLMDWLEAPDAAFTLLAPNDEAFVAMPVEDTPAADLANLLKHHIVMVPLTLANVTNGQMLPTLYDAENEHAEGELMVHKRADGHVQFMLGESMASVVEADIPAARSFIQVIDMVLMPPPMPIDGVDGGASGGDLPGGAVPRR